MKRACIYVRVSSERQAMKVSPEIQELECREYCLSRSYVVVAVYWDIEKYRAGGRMVEPSGSRRDRPQFKQMLADGYAGKFDVIVAWREDRLYRGLRPMMDVLDCLKATGIDVELAKDTFDKNFAPVKAWVGSMELEARRERTAMGMKGRLAAGKIAGGSSAVPFGYNYDRVSGKYIVNEFEAEWVRKIFKWYANGLTAHAIRQHLIEAGVPQKGRRPRKQTWEVNVIRQMLDREDYCTGIFVSRWEGQAFEITIPTLVDANIFQEVKDRKARWKAHPAGKSWQTDQIGRRVHPIYALAPGRVYCAACGVKMRVLRNRAGGKIYDYYRCNNYTRRMSLPGCVQQIRVNDLDPELWRKVWGLISEPGAFERELELRINALRKEETNAEVDCRSLERQLNELFLERQKVVTWARKGFITEDDLQSQLFILTEQEKSLARALSDARLLIGNRAEQLLQLVSIFRDRVQNGFAVINQETNTDEQAKAQFQARRRIVEGLVTRVEVMADKSIIVLAEIQLGDSASYEGETVCTSRTLTVLPS